MPQGFKSSSVHFSAPLSRGTPTTDRRESRRGKARQMLRRSPRAVSAPLHACRADASRVVCVTSRESQLDTNLSEASACVRACALSPSLSDSLTRRCSMRENLRSVLLHSAMPIGQIGRRKEFSELSSKRKERREEGREGG